MGELGYWVDEKTNRQIAMEQDDCWCEALVATDFQG
jgi:hypothetical protein